ncbi:MAG: coenzyme F420-0:L-glutamate ligase [Candidatus Daviesbacteria bacterium]|nr:coenzyme F420-0:L-glutamate ligase [Candidatus Daviesbacteria bacterium]
MKIKAIKTRKFLPPKDDLWELLSAVKSLKENCVVAVTSKVVAVGEGRCVPLNKVTKDELAIQESDKYIPRELSPGGHILHTIKDNMLIASAGIDESNGAGFYILWPKNPKLSAKLIWEFLKKKFKLQNLGVIITDSRLVPLRRGVVGIAIGYFGFKPLKDYRKTKDIFGREFEMETSNFPDSLATAAVLIMGEGSELQPIAILEDIPGLKFLQKEFKPKTEYDDFKIPEKEDMFYPFLSSAKWEKGGSGK